MGFGTEARLRECLAHLVEQVGPDGEVVLVDNGVQDRPEVPGVHVVKSATNGGFAAGCRLGVEASSGDTLLFVNSDALVRPGAVDALVTALDDPETGLVCGCVVLTKDPTRVNSVGNPVHVSGLSWAGGCGDLVVDHDTSTEVTAVTGALFATRRAVWEQLGGMHDDFFLYYEDTDLSLRCWLAGLEVRYVPEAVAVHDYEFHRNPRKMYFLERNRLQSVLTCYPRPLLLRALPVLLATEPLLLLLAARDGWAREKLQAWWWLVSHRRSLRQRRRCVSEAVVAPHALDPRLTTRLGQRQIAAPPGLGIVDSVISAYWRLSHARSQER